MIKKLLPLIVVATFILQSNQSYAQSSEDWYNIGAAIGSAARRAVDRAREKRAEEARLEREREERERQYQLERERIENERIIAQQRAAEERRLEQERIRREEERRLEQERIRQAEEAKIRESQRIEEENRKKAEAAIEKKAAQENINLYNGSIHILSSNNVVSFLTSDGDEIHLTIEGDDLLYRNSSEKEVLLICNNAAIKIKYANEPNEETLNDACQLRLKPTGSSAGIDVPLSEVFFSISSFKEIEFVKIRLSETRIR